MSPEDSGTEAAELLAAVREVTRLFRRYGIVHFITGSFASGIHGEYRATNDVDIVADFGGIDLKPIFRELASAFIADVDQARAALGSGQSFNLIHRTSFLKIDVFPLTSAFDRESARRAEAIEEVGAEPLLVATTEDILLAKLRWYRLGDQQSEVQRRDIRGLIGLNRDFLDLAYLRRWATELGVSDLLNHFLG